MKYSEGRNITEIYPDIFRISLPLFGQKPGPVNVYLIKGDSNTLIDTGVSGTADILKSSIEYLGFNFSSINKIIFTHGHIDHYGAASKIIAASGGSIETMCHKEDKGMVEHKKDVKRKTSDKFMKAMNVPFILRNKMKFMHLFFRSMSKSCTVNTTFKDGEKIKIGNHEAEIIHTPGHSRGSVCIFISSAGILFSGDHLIKHVTPNAFAMLDNDSLLPQRLSQDEYYESIAKIEKLSPKVVYPAHGEEISNLSETVSMYRENFNKRNENILNILNNGPLPVYETALKLFPDLDRKRLVLEIFLAVSEVFTHGQHLRKKGLLKFHFIKNRLILERIN